MSDLTLCKLLTPVSIAASAGTGVLNLLTPDPKEVWLDNTTSARRFSIDFDYGAPVLIDLFAWGGTNALPGGWTTISNGLAAPDEVTLYTEADLRLPTATPVTRQQGYRRLPAPVTARYVRFRCVQGGGSPTTPMYIGFMGAGRSIVTQYNKEQGSGRRLIDMGNREQLRGGGFAIEPGARKAGFKWTFGDLSDDEVAQLWALSVSCGRTDPLIVLEDQDVATAGAADRMHYCVFDSFEAYERAGGGDPTRWAFSVEEWV